VIRTLFAFLRRPRAERAALVRAVVLVGAVRAALAVVPFVRLLRGLDGLARRLPAPPADAAYRRRAAWAVGAVAGRLVPGGPCLTQALVLKFVLSRRGHPAVLRIGVAKESGLLHAHAWLESDGEVVIGGEEALGHLRPLPQLGGAA
jgi:hypothetical protein